MPAAARSRPSRPNSSKATASPTRRTGSISTPSLPLGKIARREEIVLERDEFFLLSHNEKVIPVDIEREKLEYCRTLVY